MPKQPFTPSGVQAKQQELYALSNSDLLAQANDIRSDLNTWLQANFTLDASQVAYLNGMDARWIQFTAQVTGFAVENRLAVAMTVKGQGSGKLIRTSPGLTCDYSPSGGFVAGGTLTFEVTYS